MDEVLDIEGHLFAALRCGMGVVRLHGAGDAVDALKDEGQKGDAELFGERGVHGVEAGDVVFSVVGRKGDAGEGDVGAGGLELADDAGEVGLGLGEGKAAEAVVAAELDDDDAGVAGDDALDAVEGVFGGVAADAGVENEVGVAVGAEELLEVGGVGLAGVGAEAGGEAVAEAVEDGAAAGSCGVGRVWERHGSGPVDGRIFLGVRSVFTAGESEGCGEGREGENADTG